MSFSLSKINNIVIKKKNPVSLVHFVTNRCNARCSFLLDFDNSNTQDELNLNDIDKLTKIREYIININGRGEPYEKKDLIEIAKLYILN